MKRDKGRGDRVVVVVESGSHEGIDIAGRPETES